MRYDYLKQHHSDCKALQEVIEGCKNDEKDLPPKRLREQRIEDIAATSAGKMEIFADSWTLTGVRSNIPASFFLSEDFAASTQATVQTGSFKWKESYWVSSLGRLKAQLRESIRQLLSGKPLCLILDGWRVPYKRGEHAHAFLVADYDGNLVFHSLVGDMNTHNASYMNDLIVSVIGQVNEDYDAVVTSIVSDNAAVMLAAVRQVSERFPIVLHPCCAHWLQLTLNDLSSHPLVVKAWEICTGIRKGFASKEGIRWLREGIAYCQRGTKRTSLAPPCATRWSSVVDSSVIILSLQPSILKAKELANDRLPFSVTEDDFLLVSAVTEVLIPICNATDAVQRDSSGLLKQELVLNHVEAEIHSLKQQAAAAHEHELVDFITFVEASLSTRRIAHDGGLSHRAAAAALFLAVKPSKLDDETCEEGKVFLVDNGARFLKALRPRDSRYAKSDQELTSRIKDEISLHQLDDCGAEDVQHIDVVETINNWKYRATGRKSSLALLALVLFAVRSSEAAAERAFSHAGSRLTPHRNRLSTEKLAEEVFVRINSRLQEEPTRRYRKPRNVENHIGGMNGDLSARLFQSEDPSVDGVESAEDRIGTECLPLIPPEDPAELATLSCSSCSALYLDDSNMSSAPDWWCCRRCNAAYCRDCADHELDDASGLCEACRNPEEAIMNQLRSRPRRQPWHPSSRDDSVAETEESARPDDRVDSKHSTGRMMDKDCLPRKRRRRDKHE